MEINEIEDGKITAVSRRTGWTLGGADVVSTVADGTAVKTPGKNIFPYIKENIDEIIDETDGIIVARGDLSVEVPFVEVPVLQKMITQKCREKGKFVIVATEMLESMKKSARPTRAEISDVANAIYDGTSAIMLSGESAAGAYPIEAVNTMSRIAERAEEDLVLRSLAGGAAAAADPGGHCAADG